MISPAPDHRSPNRKDLDEQIAAEPPLAAPELSGSAKPAPVEAHLLRHSRPVAVAGIVENGLVRPLAPDIKLHEHSRVIIVTTQ